MNKNDFPRATTPEERRRAFIRNSRETARIVKRTLLVTALFAGLWYLYLLKTQSSEPQSSEPQSPKTQSSAPSTSNDAQPVLSKPQTDVEPFGIDVQGL